MQRENVKEIVLTLTVFFFFAYRIYCLRGNKDNWNKKTKKKKKEKRTDIESVPLVNLKIILTMKKGTSKF